MTIKRGDMPAMPLTGDAYTDYAGHVNKGSGYEPDCQGMTIREQMAMAAMQGLLASGRVLDDELTEEATMAADMQINHLEKTK